MEKLKNKISEKNYNDLELFLINANLDKKQRTNLLQIVSEIFYDGESRGTHNSLNSSQKITESKKKEARPRSWEY